MNRINALSMFVHLAHLCFVCHSFSFKQLLQSQISSYVEIQLLSKFKDIVQFVQSIDYLLSNSKEDEIEDTTSSQSNAGPLATLNGHIPAGIDLSEMEQVVSFCHSFHLAAVMSVSPINRPVDFQLHGNYLFMICIGMQYKTSLISLQEWKFLNKSVNVMIHDLKIAFNCDMQVLTELLLYYTRFQRIVKRVYPSQSERQMLPWIKQLVPTNAILLEIKTYSKTF